MEETFILKKTGIGHTKTITSKRNVYVYVGGEIGNPDRGRLCVKEFGFEHSDNWMIKFVSGTGRSMRFTTAYGLELYEGEG